MWGKAGPRSHPLAQIDGETKMSKKEPAPKAVEQEIENEEEEAKVVRLKPDHTRYENRPETTASGRCVYDIGDKVAEEFRTMTLDKQYEAVAKALAEENETEPANELAALFSKYETKNLGMQRMNLGNKMRGILARKERREAAKLEAEEKKAATA